MGTEYELKFRADEAQRAGILAAFGGESRTIAMQTTYYDTPDGALSAKKWTLRRRLENGTAVCTLKTPGDGKNRGEWETQEENIDRSIQKLCKLGAPEELSLLCQTGLAPVCGARFTRQAVHVEFGESTLELALDAGSLFAGSSSVPISEVEVELKTGRREDADTFADLLCRKFGLTAEGKSKFRRALDLCSAKKPQLQSLFSRYDRLVLFDTETTGLNYCRDEIIEFAAVVLECPDGEVTVMQEYDELVTLSPGGFVPPQIQSLTGITDADIRERGIPKTRLCRDIAQMLQGKVLLLAYNAHFDLSFLFYLLLRDGDPAILKGKDKLDLLTVYKDRHSYPHKLCNAIDVYKLGDKVVNSHRAVDDVLATVEVMKAMEVERDDLERYINLFGYNPKYGISGKPIGSVTYKPQPFDPAAPLYL